MTGDEMREALARKLSTTTTCHGEEWPSEFHYRQVDVLLPVVRKIAADELNDLADSIPCSDGELEAKQMARARADALDPS